MELKLHEYTADVEEICDQALKEEKMEDTLRKLNDTWGGEQHYHSHACMFTRNGSSVTT